MRRATDCGPVTGSVLSFSIMSSTDHNPPLHPQNVSVPEMGRFQRQIVDNSLEEGQFQSGIDMLDQLRSPDHKPSVYATVSYR